MTHIETLWHKYHGKPQKFVGFWDMSYFGNNADNAGIILEIDGEFVKFTHNEIKKLQEMTKQRTVKIGL